MKTKTKKIAQVALGIATMMAPAMNSSAYNGKKILVIVSSENQLALKNGNVYATGYYLNELTVPVKHLAEAGYTLVFADPKGNAPTMDKNSDNVNYFGGSEEKREEIKNYHDSLVDLQKPLSFKEVMDSGLEQYDGLFIPGGHAPMIDLMANATLGKILRYFHKSAKPTALICHGPIALAAATDNAQEFQMALINNDQSKAQSLASRWPYRGYNMTIFSNAEEAVAIKHMGGDVQFAVESALQTAGGTVTVAAQWTSHVVRDRELITGQNPFSDEKLSQEFIKALNE